MKYNKLIINSLKHKIFKKIVSKNHTNLTRKTFYFSVFLNDAVSDVIQTYGLYEREILIPLFNILSSKYDFRKSTAIDIGANIGNHTIFFSEIFEEVFSFEPNPVTFSLLSVNTFFLKNVTAINLGLSHSSMELDLSAAYGNIGSSSTSINHNSGVNHKIKLIRLDDFKFLPSNIELIKIDVEGMESEVLHGAKETILANHPTILFEQWASQFKNETSEAVEILKDHGYYFFTLVESYYHKNKWLRRLKRLPLMFINGSLNYKIQKIEAFEAINYPMIIAIFKSKVGLDP